MTFDDIVTRVQRRVIDLPSAVQAEVPTLVNEAMGSLQSLHNFSVMRAVASATTTAGSRALLTLPTDWKEARGKPYLREELGSVRKLGWTLDIREADLAFGVDPDLDFGYPSVLGIAEPSDTLGTRAVQVYPFPDGLSDYSDGEYRIVIPYWRILPALSGSDSNWFTNRAAEFLTKQATGEAFGLNWDEKRAQYWFQQAAQEFKKVVRADKLEQVAGVEFGMFPRLDGDTPGVEIE